MKGVGEGCRVVWSQKPRGRGWLRKEAATTLLHSHSVIASLQHGASGAQMHEDSGTPLGTVVSQDVTRLKG